MKITAISDTHCKHAGLSLSGGDLLIHAGDITGSGNIVEVLDFLDWFAEQPYTYKVFIAGNHDYFFERAEPSRIREVIPDNVIYLNDSGVEIGGLRIWGSPVQPWFFDWAFNRRRGEEIDRHWQLIPEDTDILVTHGPAYGVLDRTVRGERVGCRDLLRRVQAIQPRYHIVGHIHESYGVVEEGGTTFINASVLDVKYRLAHRAVEWEVGSE